MNIGVKHDRLSHSVMSDLLQHHGLETARLLCPWNSPGKYTGVGCHSLLQGILLTQGSNPDLLHCRWSSALKAILYQLPYIIFAKFSNQLNIEEDNSLQ